MRRPAGVPEGRPHVARPRLEGHVQLRERLLLLVREDLVDRDNRQAGREHSVYNESYQRSMGQRIGQ